MSSFGLVLVVVGWVIIALVFRENSFAAPVVKHQETRGHKVVDTGVYRVVRHPMYAGIFLFGVGMALMAGIVRGSTRRAAFRSACSRCGLCLRSGFCDATFRATRRTPRRCGIDWCRSVVAQSHHKVVEETVRENLGCPSFIRSKRSAHFRLVWHCLQLTSKYHVEKALLAFKRLPSFGGKQCSFVQSSAHRRLQAVAHNELINLKNSLTYCGWRWRFIGDEAAGFVGAIAEGAFGGLAAAAEGDGGFVGRDFEFGAASR